MGVGGILDTCLLEISLFLLGCGRDDFSVKYFGLFGNCYSYYYFIITNFEGFMHTIQTLQIMLSC